MDSCDYEAFFIGFQFDDCPDQTQHDCGCKERREKRLRDEATSPEATILAARRLEQRSPFAKINGSVHKCVPRATRNGCRNHRSKLGVTYWHRGNNGKSCHELNPTEFQTELDTAQSKWGIIEKIVDAKEACCSTTHVSCGRDIG